MRTSLTLAVVLASIGCATGQMAGPGARPLSTTSYFISEHGTVALDVLVPQRDRSLYDIVVRTWPAMLRPPRTSNVVPRGPNDVVGVYADGAFIGGVETLRSVFARDVVQMRRLSQAEEFHRFGHAHPGGGLVIAWSTPHALMPRR